MNRISPALTPEEWAGVRNGKVGIVGTPNAQANHQVAAVCLYGQPFGFTREDVELLRRVVKEDEYVSAGGLGCIPDGAERLMALADRIAALLPPETPA